MCPVCVPAPQNVFRPGVITFTHTSSRFSPVMRSFRNSASLERPNGAYPRLISNFGSTIAHKIPLCELLDEPLTSKLCHAPTPPSLLPADLEPWGGQKRWSGSPAIVDEVTAYLRSRDPDDDSAMTEEYRQRPSMWLSSPMHVDLAEGHYFIAAATEAPFSRSCFRAAIRR